MPHLHSARRWAAVGVLIVSVGALLATSKGVVGQPVTDTQEFAVDLQPGETLTLHAVARLDGMSGSVYLSTEATLVAEEGSSAVVFTQESDAWDEETSEPYRNEATVEAEDTLLTMPFLSIDEQAELTLTVEGDAAVSGVIRVDATAEYYGDTGVEVGLELSLEEQ